MRKSWLLFAILCAASAPALAVTDAERIQVYHEFRTAFDAHHFDAALPLAAKLVSMTEEQYGPTDRALVNPLSNLGTTQYRMSDYKSAEQTFLRSVKIVEDSGGAADRMMMRPMHGLGATYFKSGQYDEASVALKRALDLSRNLDGLFNPGQMQILNPLISSLVELERHDEVEREYQYAVRVVENAYGRNDARVLDPLDRYGRWMERMGRYTTARVLYARALEVAEQNGGQSSILSVDPLTGISRTYRLEGINGSEDTASLPQPFDSVSDFATPVVTTQRMNADGERAAILAVQVVQKHSPVDDALLGRTLLELGDWYMCENQTLKAMTVYTESWRAFGLSGSTAPLDQPRQLAYRAPNSSITRSHLSPDNIEEHFVEVSFTVMKDGKTGNIVMSSTDASESQQKQVVSAIKRARYAPRFVGGDPVETPEVKWRERLVTKRKNNN
ncbi:MAG TPA: tetratricopeptide repeat protein [Steroidobacteraceae bacterium]|jgi:tetratricopeptide (TPR) repeat protein